MKCKITGLLVFAIFLGTLAMFGGLIYYVWTQDNLGLKWAITGLLSALPSAMLLGLLED